MGVETDFELNLTQLNSNHRKLQKSVHPDKFAASPHAEKLAAVNKMAQINEAVQTLKNPILRAQHLLQLREWRIPGDEQTVKDMSLLIEQMELREQLEELESKPNPLPELEHFSHNLTLLINQQIQTITSQFCKQEASEIIYLSVNRLKFLSKLQKEVLLLDEKLEELYD